MKRKLISFDWAIKKILRSKANFGILEGFLSELLFTDITILEVLESEGNKESQEDKFNRVDIKVRDAAGKILIVEVQYSREMDYFQRILYGACKVIAEHLREGDAYAGVSKVISVNILYHDFGTGDDYIYHGTTRFVGLHKNSVLELSEDQKKLYTAEKTADLYPEYYLINVTSFDNIAKDSLDEWVYFLKNEEIEEYFQAKGLQEAKQKLDVLKMKPADRRAYELYQTKLHHDASIYQSTYVLGHTKRELNRELNRNGLETGMKDLIWLNACCKKVFPLKPLSR